MSGTTAISGQNNPQSLGFGALTPIRYFFAVALALGVIFAVAGPDHDYAGGWVLLQWPLQTLSAMVALVLAQCLINPLMGWRLFSFRVVPGQSWFGLLLSGFIGSLIYAPVSLLIEVMFAAQPPEISALEVAQEWWDTLPSILVCWLVINAPWRLGWSVHFNKAVDQQIKHQPRHKVGQQIMKQARQESANWICPTESEDVQHDALKVIEPSEKNMSELKFLLLCQCQDLSKLLYIKSELHYLQVVFEEHSELILYSLKDAVTELTQVFPNAQSGQCHRSYWVNLKKVESLKKTGRQGELQLGNADRVPVSRSRLASIQAQL